MRVMFADRVMLMPQIIDEDRNAGPIFLKYPA